MLRKMMTVALVALLAALALGTTGCRAVRIADSSGVKNVTKDVPLDGAAKIDAVVEMGVGELTLSAEPTGTSAFNGDFSFGDPTWEPEVKYVVSGGTGSLDVRMPDSLKMPAFKDVTNIWDVKLAGGVPTDLKLTLGVGKGDVDLRNVDVRTLKMICGVGETILDLSGPRTEGLAAKIESGVGDLTIRLPKAVGVKVDGRQDGLGNMTADGFIAQGDSWVNEAYAGSGPKIEIDLTRGIGNVTLVLVD